MPVIGLAVPRVSRGDNIHVSGWGRRRPEGDAMALSRLGFFPVDPSEARIWVRFMEIADADAHLAAEPSKSAVGELQEFSRPQPFRFDFDSTVGRRDRPLSPDGAMLESQCLSLTASSSNSTATS